jgi:hypothetical protein|tara:strand:- start:752 stop:1381 length:630 start_codon:yes stop_codon:yes gene_type:complete
MKFLLDVSAAKLEARRDSPLVSGQLLTPLTRYKNWGGEYAIDNGAFSGLKVTEFAALLTREEGSRKDCLFVTVPDIVGNARRTLELWDYRHDFAPHWPHALVAQDGIEDMPIPWADMGAVFIGGRSPWKDSQAVLDIVKTAKALGKHVHVGRVNTLTRFRLFRDAGADTCDGSGVCRFDHMLEDIQRGLAEVPNPHLFEELADGSVQGV